MSFSWCELTLNDEGPLGYPTFRLSVRFRYDADAVEDLKALIPSHWRTYVEATQTWWVEPSLREALIPFARRFTEATWEEGDLITGLHTGITMKRLPQLELFEEG